MNDRLGGYKIGKVPDDANKKASKNVESIPQKVDLRKFLSSIEYQVGNSCVANAMAGAYEYLAKRELGEAGDISRLYIYYNARYLDGSHEEDTGSYMRKAIDGLIEYGACNENLWPNDYERINEEPPQDAYDQGSNFKIVSTEYIETELNIWRETLAEGYPIAFALNTFKNFDDANKNKGRVPMPKDNEETRTTHGWHAMLCVGYSDIDRVFIVRNSWGETWGDKGYCYIPYDYMMHENYNAHDSWIIKSIENLDYSQDIEIEDEDSYFYDDEYLHINSFYVYTEEEDDFIADLEALIMEYVETEEDYFFDYTNEEDEHGVYIQFNDFYLNVADEPAFIEELEELAIAYGGEDGYDFGVGEEGEEEEDSEEEEDESEDEEDTEDEESGRAKK